MRRGVLPLLLCALGVLAIITGILPLERAESLFARIGPILGFVVAITIVAELAAKARLFAVVGDYLAQFGRSRVWLLWLLIVGLAVVSTVFLSLDTTAVLLTPVVIVLAQRASIAPMPFALTTIWLANTASLLLPVSNLTNLLSGQKMGATPLQFAGLLWAPAVVGLVIPVAMLWFLFRKSFAERFEPSIPVPVGDRPLLLIAAATVVSLLVALISGIAVVWPASIAAVILLVAFWFRRREELHFSLLPAVPLLITVGLFLLIETLHAQGLTGVLHRAVPAGDGLPALLQLSAAGVLAANVLNNLPAYLALEPVADSPLRLGALLVGVNLGPLVTPWASLATLLWYERVRSLGMTVRWGRFALAGVVLVACAVPTAVFMLWLSGGAPR
ncbi:ArsB/NhaD family transporter [Saxibacter everestensis]|uniref:ArsB/NhaD family transporter n=1 Tax=Saxibacter everestensis TaxID=2909229 RepID=A0ABY8QX41_9MICO|nr:ArsB/NhaD family transporter [Brevibacteriaceae bacterium ZFBP1038]